VTTLAAGKPGDGERIDNDNDDDWRAFRARLVQNGLPSLDDGASTTPTFETTQTPPNDVTPKTTETSIRSTTNDPTRYAHESTPLVEIGTILLSLPTTDLRQALERQHRHRSVVLITSVTNEPSNGDDGTTQPEERRWAYTGVVLNRPIGLGLDGKTMYGGDVSGSDAPDGCTAYTCLHSLDRSDPLVRDASTRIIGGLSVTPMDGAFHICKKSDGRVCPNDFTTFAGFCGWEPGQLEREMGEPRGEWIALSVDAKSIVNELRRQGAEVGLVAGEPTHQSLGAGTKTWRNFLNMVGRSESTATGRIPAGQLGFYDRMLEVWAEENLGAVNDCGDTGTDTDGTIEEDVDPVGDSGELIGPGTLVRATEHVSNAVLLSDPKFVRSLVLVLEETDQATVGIILNQPLAAAVECLDGELPLPLRYGGPMDTQDWTTFDYGSREEFVGYYDEHEEGDESDEGDESSSFLWLHRNADLVSQSPDDRGGSPLGTTGIYLIEQDDAIRAIQSGTLHQEDTMVFSGVCVWEKAPDLERFYSDGISEQIDTLQTMEVVRPFDQHDDGALINSVWDILGRRQGGLTKETLDANVDAAADAWVASAGTVEGDKAVLADSVSSGREELSDAALRAWLGVNLLGDPLGTLIEVKSAEQRRELRGQ